MAKLYVFGVLDAIAHACKDSDRAYPDLTGIARSALVGMADAQSRNQCHAEKAYRREAFDACPDLIELLGIEHGSEKARRIYVEAYRRPYPM